MTQEESWLLKEKYNGTQSPAFSSDCDRLKKGEPLAYVIGHVPFLGCTIFLDSHPLIPRTETEFWVDAFIAHVRKDGVTKPINILDLCSGSGAIGVAVAFALPSIHTLTFCELDERHLPTIKKNCTENHIRPTTTKFVSGHLFSNLTPGTNFDYILCNPPYIDKSLNRTDQSVLDFEPSLALFADDAGLALLKEIIHLAPKFLKPFGELWLEHEPEQATAIQTLGQGTFTVSTHKDQYGVIRFSQLVLQ